MGGRAFCHFGSNQTVQAIDNKELGSHRSCSKNAFPRSLLATEREVMFLKLDTVVILVLGVATLFVGLVGLVIKLIELGRK